jgi:hypothetical protein
LGRRVGDIGSKHRPNFVQNQKPSALTRKPGGPARYICKKAWSDRPNKAVFYANPPI